jgi:hypothetical protein
MCLVTITVIIIIIIIIIAVFKKPIRILASGE